MKGKDKCKALKEIRQKIAEENDIEYVVRECSHKGDCRGTCPRCEAELLYLERELEKRRSLGKKVVVTGLAVGMAATISGCQNPFTPVVNSLFGNNNNPVVELAGEAEPPILEGEAQPPIESDSGEIVEIDGDVAYIEGGSESCPDDGCPEDGSEEDCPEDGSEDLDLAGEALPADVEN